MPLGFEADAEVGAGDGSGDAPDSPGAEYEL
jgi:hypothetical protein